MANKEGLPLATEGANVSYFLLRIFTSKSHSGIAVWLLYVTYPRLSHAFILPAEKKKPGHVFVFGVLAGDFLAKSAKS